MTKDHDGLRAPRSRASHSSTLQAPGSGSTSPPAAVEDPAARARGASVPTFAELAGDALALRASRWSSVATGRAFQRMLDVHVLPQLGGLPVDRIDVSAVMQVVLPHWQGPGSTGDRMLRATAIVMDLALVQGHRHSNPARAARQELPAVSRPRRPFPGVPHGDVAGALARIREAGRSGAARGDDMAALALELLILTIARPAIVRGANWDEFDLERRRWTIPAGRTLNDVSHLVPLSRQALDVLGRVRRLVGDTGRLFRYRSDGEWRLLSESALARLMRKLRLDGTPIGFRGAFCTWAAEVAGMPVVPVRAALGYLHFDPDPIVKANVRPTLLEPRRAYMQRWADHVAPDGQEDDGGTSR